MEIKHKKVEPRFNTFTSDFISFFVIYIYIYINQMDSFLIQQYNILCFNWYSILSVFLVFQIFTVS